jgi:hypothetical protein
MAESLRRSRRRSFEMEVQRGDNLRCKRELVVDPDTDTLAVGLEVLEYGNKSWQWSRY